MVTKKKKHRLKIIRECKFLRRATFKPVPWATLEDRIVRRAADRLLSKEHCTSVSLMKEIKQRLPKRTIGQIRARFLYYRNKP